MLKTEINKKNNFATWEIERIKELNSDSFHEIMGTFLFENDSIKLWDLTLKPNERIPFGQRIRNYSVLCMTDGMAISRFADGKIELMHFKKGENHVCENQGKEVVKDFQNIGKDILKFIVVGHKVT